jgi:hypothetical protein
LTKLNFQANNGIMADHKAEIANAETVGFGKVIFFSPGLPDMNLIVFRKKYGYQIICIDIYVDATGESLQAARKNFSLALNTHIKQTFEAHNGNEKAAIKDIVQVAYDKGDIKSLYFDKYRQAKHKYLAEMIEKESKAKSIKKDIADFALSVFWKMASPFLHQHIRFRLTAAT